MTAIGDSPTDEELITAYHNLVVVIARPYANDRTSLEDLVQEGAIGLLWASERYDPRHGAFATYARFAIRRYIHRYAAGNCHGALSIPERVWGSAIKARKELAELRQEIGREPTDFEIENHLLLDPKTLRSLIALLEPADSIDRPIGGSGAAMIDTYVHRDMLGVSEESGDGESLPRWLRYVLDDLPATVVEMHYGLLGGEPLDIREIALRLNISVGRANRMLSVSLYTVRGMGVKRVEDMRLGI